MYAANYYEDDVLISSVKGGCLKMDETVQVRFVHANEGAGIVNGV